MIESVTYKCVLHYKDGLNMNLNLTELELDEALDVWTEELTSLEKDELVYLEIRKTEKSE